MENKQNYGIVIYNPEEVLINENGEKYINQFNSKEFKLGGFINQYISKNIFNKVLDFVSDKNLTNDGDFLGYKITNQNIISKDELLSVVTLKDSDDINYAYILRTEDIITLKEMI